VAGKKTNIEDIYDLSPMQQGMLFHTLQAPSSGVYHEQLSCVLEGELDRGAFREAWQQVVIRHPVLRTSFHQIKSGKPLQLVCSNVDLPWVEEDWCQFSDDEQHHRLHQYLETDRQRGFALDCPPLMRIALFRLASNRYQLVWSHHHLLLDGWCLSLLIKEVFEHYQACRHGALPNLPPVRPYRDYIAWLQQQDMGAAERFWRAQLAGATPPPPFFAANRAETPPVEASQAEESLYLTEALTATLQTIAQQYHLTLNTLVQGVWAILLSRYSGERDVVFGSVVSGRPPTLTGVESMVGLY